MANGRHGLGNNVNKPAYLITPCPAVVDQFFEDQLHYMKLTPKANKKADPFIVTYAKVLSHPDNPEFIELKGDVCISYIYVDIFNGNIIDQGFEWKNRYHRKFGPIRSFEECPENKALLLVFKWHLNIVHMSREYLKGGWLYRAKRQRQLEATKDKYVILNKKGFTNILDNARPEELC